MVKLIYGIVFQLKLFFGKEAWLAEFSSGLSTVWLGILTSMADPDKFPSIHFLSIYFNPDSLGKVICLLGVGQTFALRYLDNQWKWPWLRWVNAIVIGSVWGTYAVSCHLTVPYAPWIAGLLGLCWINCFLVFRIFWRA